jgi:hypothetical protein
VGPAGEGHAFAGPAPCRRSGSSSPVRVHEPYRRTFRWAAGGADWARFENPAHDFPQLVEYRRSGEKLRARIAGPGKGGKESVISFEYERCPAEP